MKNKITCLLAGAALFGATANAEIVLADGLSASGYIDINAFDLEGQDRGYEATEFELGLSFTPAESDWSATAELSYDIGLFDAPEEVTTETVAITYQYSDALSFTFGKVYTYMGLESDDAPNNYFITYAGANSTKLYSAEYADGICADYSAGGITLGVWTDALGDEAVEYYAAYSGIEGLTLAVAIADNQGGSETTNFMASYEFGDFLVMAEDVDSSGFGSMADLDITSITVAYSMGDTTFAVRSVDGEYDVTGDYDKFSVSAFHAINDNVAVGVEYSDEDTLEYGDTAGYGVELLYVF